MVELALSMTFRVPEVAMFPFDPSRMMRILLPFAAPTIREDELLILPVTVRAEPMEEEALDWKPL